MCRLRPLAYPWGATHPGPGNGSVCTFQEKNGGKKGEKSYFVIYAPTGLEPVAVAAPNGAIE